MSDLVLTSEQLAQLASADGLPGLYNRLHFLSLAETEWSRYLRYARPLALLVVDIDHFKSINDTHGHDIGDEILKEFAQRIATNVRGIDLACRYGGEEFVVVMPDTDVSFAYMVAERLRQQVADQPFRISTAPGTLSLTISIGVTASEGTADTAEALLRRADQALYRAKRDGRNRVVADAA